jgi:hypothetical protein
MLSCVGGEGERGKVADKCVGVGAPGVNNEGETSGSKKREEGYAIQNFYDDALCATRVCPFYHSPAFCPLSSFLRT